MIVWFKGIMEHQRSATDGFETGVVNVDDHAAIKV